jgi:threonine synthase
MNFYSTNNKNHKVSLKEAVIQGLAPDQGLYMPETIPVLPEIFFQTLPEKTFPEMAFEVARNVLGSELPDADLKKMVDHTIQFDAPLVEVDKNIFALELFHGPTLAFKDFGARFMSQMLGYFAKQQKKEIIILVATSGDTGSAVANGFLGVKGTRVVVLYPSGKVSDIQEKQFTTLGQNITAIEIDGTFDDCQALVKQAFSDSPLREELFLTSANSINIARLLPQMFYYFYAYSRLKTQPHPPVFSVPSGNFGNLTAGLLAQRMGLPVKHFIASTNANDVVPDYLESGHFQPRPSQQTISNAMDVGNPSNFYRMLDLFDGNRNLLSASVSGFSFTDAETRTVMTKVFGNSGYLLDPHGAVAYLGLKKYRSANDANVPGIFLATAHPAKFREVVEETLGKSIEIPEVLLSFMKQKKLSVPMKKDFNALKDFLFHLK